MHVTAKSKISERHDKDKKGKQSKKVGCCNTNLLRVGNFVSRFSKVCNVSNADSPLERWRPEMNCDN